MRTCNILLLTICIVASACKKDKVTPPSSTTDPEVLVDTFMENYPELYISVDRYLKLYDNQYHRYSARYIPLVSDGVQITEDLGGISYNGTSLVRVTSGEPIVLNNYLWPDGAIPLPNGGIWTIPANKYFPKTKLTDPALYPEVISFPDTILRSSPTITIRTNKVYLLNIRVSYDTSQYLPFDYSIYDYDRDSMTAILDPTAIQDSVFISLMAINRVLKYHDRVCFERRSFWSKWVYVKD